MAIPYQGGKQNPNRNAEGTQSKVPADRLLDTRKQLMAE
jgi:hypothetical protein